MNHYGLIGYPLSHSFSKKYFSRKFEKENITDCQYHLFPIETISELPQLLKENPDLKGLNVTIPYKEQVIPFLDEIETSAAEVKAVNTIKIKQGKLIGYNTDIYGFEQSLKQYVVKNKLEKIEKALILGTGGASKAIAYVLEKMDVRYTLVSRTIKKGIICYQDLNKSVLSKVQLIVNTTPLGTSPNTETYPDIPYEYLNDQHLLFDVVYNPEKTVFLKRGEEKDCHILNGHNMLVGQAEKAWEIWTK